MGKNMPESMLLRKVITSLSHSALPTSTPTRHPAIECPFDSELSSSATSLAPSTAMIDSGPAELRMKL